VLAPNNSFKPSPHRQLVQVSRNCCFTNLPVRALRAGLTQALGACKSNAL
jgi:hypothetical protein